MNKVIYVQATQAHVSHNTDAPVIAIKLYETGYYPIYTRATADKLNHGKYSAEVVESAIAASMFGWHCPAAKPAIGALTA